MFLVIFVAVGLSCLTTKVSCEVCTKSICEYEFVIRETRTMMYTADIDNAYQVMLNEDGSLRLKATPHGFHRTVPNITVPLDKVHTADGVNRTIITINDQFPGPTIEVLEGAEVVVTVVNDLLKEGLTIHWHGIHMRNNPWMDGVPFVGQCPVEVKQTFQYRFLADPPGTHWYHSHFEMQKADGLFGALIVHRSRPRVPYHIITLSDWFPWHSTEIEISNPLRITRKGYGDTFYADEKRSYIFDWTLENPLHYWSGLVNGKGRYGNNSAPLSVFSVKAGSTYHLHVINVGLVYPYRFSIDQHQLTVIESDGHRVKPVTVDSAIIFNGESYVFEFTAKQKPSHGRYWIRGVNIRTGIGPGSPPDGQMWDTKAILQYEGGEGEEDPISEERECTADRTCLVLNCAWRVYSKVWYPHHLCFPVSNLRFDNTFYDPEKLRDTRNEDVHEVFLNFGFPIGSAVNGRRFISPRAPLFQDPNTWGLTECSKQCNEEGCWCTHVVELPAKRTIQLILNSYNNAKLSHPVHIHGHSFQVLKIGYPVQNETTGQILATNPDITCENSYCTKMHWTAGPPKDLNFDYPPLKDTVIVPSWGYTVVRLVSDNPGYWLVHCHVGNHQSEGMALVLNESFAHQPPSPRGYPTCQKFGMDHSEFQEMLQRNKRCLADGCPHERSSSAGIQLKGRDNNCKDYSLATLCVTSCILAILLVGWIIFCKLLTKKTALKTNNQTGNKDDLL